MPTRLPVARRSGFLVKVAAALALVALADALFYGEGAGATLGLFALAWAALLALAVPAVRKNRPATLALGAAAAFGLVMVDDPSLLAWALFWVALSSAALLPRRRFDDAGRWAWRLIGHALVGPAAPIRDARRVARLRPGRGTGIGGVAALLALPVVGGATFLALFAGANPLIGSALASVRLPEFWATAFHLAFWAVVLAVVWPSLRPRASVPSTAPGAARVAFVADLPVATLALSLATFNGIFAVQNALDIAFLWSGAALPTLVSVAEYAREGAYLLIATALLAGLFVLVALRPGGPGARSPLVRRLVVLWVAQNLLLVASSVLRTLNYIEASMMTVLRLQALAWMALVAVGLVLICRRMLEDRSSAWLLDANAVAAAIVLWGASVVDLGTTAAAWNVSHARRGDRIDLCYLGELGSSALLPLIALERRAGGPRLRDRVAWLRGRALGELEAAQADRHRWTWRGARRLAAGHAALGPNFARPRPAPNGRRCDGSPVPPPPIAVPALTGGPPR